MKTSCNGCRVLRKGCSDGCTIRPCLQWIKSPEAQGNATVFLAKFYGRAGLINLVNAGPDHLRPAIFRSLLYEACGRIVNPIYGSVGLLWSGSWHLCHAAVDAVLKGEPIAAIPFDAAAAAVPAVKAYDIRHVGKNSGAAATIHKVIRTQPRFKRVARPTALPGSLLDEPASVWPESVSHAEGESTEAGEGSHVSQAESEGCIEHEVVRLDLTLGLGFGFGPGAQKKGEPVSKPAEESTLGADACPMELGLSLTA